MAKKAATKEVTPEVTDEVNEGVYTTESLNDEQATAEATAIQDGPEPDQQPSAYDRLKSAFEKALTHGHFDLDYARALKKEAGIL